jgi:hypothetical protein
MSAVNFDEASHTYTVEGRKLPSVTQVLLAERLIDDRWFTEWARERGSAVHLACQMVAEGDLDETSLDPRIAGYVDAYRLFLAETGFDPHHLEVTVVSKSDGYAGRFDQAGTDRLDRLGIIDLKTGAPNRATGVQLSAYSRAWYEESKYNAEFLWGVHLQENGRYKIEDYSEFGKPTGTGFAVFRAALTLMKWRMQ